MLWKPDNLDNTKISNGTDLLIMKISYLLLLAIFSLTFMGCLSVHSVRDYPTTEKFYEDFNKSVKNKITYVRLNEDSLFIYCEDTRINNDTLIFLSELKNSSGKLFLRDIKDINYNYPGTDFSKLSGKITLKNDKELLADDIIVMPDSSIHFKAKSYKFIPIVHIKEVSYKKRWLGAGSGFLIGSLAGFVAGLSVLASTSGKDTGYTPFYYYLSIQAIGSITGTILGAIHGYVYTYQFNP